MRVLVRLIVAAWVALGCVSMALAAAPASAGSSSADHDPLEGFNRRIFWFNDKVDTYVLVPVATGWEKITPARVRECLSNFFQNLRFPITAGNDLLQAKPIAA